VRAVKIAWLFFACAFVACSSSKSSPSNDAGSSAVSGDWDPNPFGGDRPVQLYVPTSYHAGTPMPLVILLHGYGASGDLQELLFHFREQAEARGFLYAHPDGTIDKMGKRFWNATDGCCNLYGSTVDDSSYLSNLVTEIEGRYGVDKKRIYFAGHSNGAFMSHRMACEHADTIAAIVALAGSNWIDKTKCNPSAPVAVLQVHGDADDEIPYNGTSTIPSAKTSVEDWAGYDGCSLTPDTSSPPMDLDDGIAGAETTAAKYESGCRPNGGAELWTIAGGSHVPGINDTFRTKAIDFLFAHPKP
jgi:polyhydroxybutyrate depolymerase